MPVDCPNQGSLPVRTRTAHPISIRAHEAREARPDFYVQFQPVAAPLSTYSRSASTNTRVFFGRCRVAGNTA